MAGGYRNSGSFFLIKHYSSIFPELIIFKRKFSEKETGLGGFEPPASGLEARRYVQAKPQALFWPPITFALVDNIPFLLQKERGKKRLLFFYLLIDLVQLPGDALQFFFC